MRTRSPGRRPLPGHDSSGWAGAEPDWLATALDGAERGRRRARIVFVVLAIGVAVGLGGAFAWAYSPAMTNGPSLGRERPKDPPRLPNGPAAVVPGPGKPGNPTQVLPPQVPARGSGTFTRASGGSLKVGTGRLMRYAVEVEGGIGQRANVFARVVDGILANRRGWTAGGKWAFQRVGSGRADFVVKLASPGTVDKICGKHGLDTGGRVNCAGGSDVVINLKRWLLLTLPYKGKPELYHALAINHEVGHRLGFGHMACPRKGSPAPVMQQQINGMHGCVVNGWPYDARKRLISGPATR